MNNESQKSKQIGDHVYTCRKLMAGEGLRVLARLMNLIGPSVKSMNDGGEGEDSALSSVVGSLLSNPLLGDQLEYFTKTFAPHATVQLQGGEAELSKVFETHFAGNYFELVQWLIFCFEVNHGGFLAQAGINVQALIQAAVNELSSRSPQARAKSGPSGKSSSPGGSTKATGVSTIPGP